MSELVSFDALGIVGALLVAAAAVRRSVETRSGVPWTVVAVVAGGAVSVVAADVRVLAGAWLLASVAAARGASDDRSAVLGTLGDAVVLGGLAAAAVDGATVSLPWESAGAVPVWLPGFVAVGLAVRVVAAGRETPALAVVAAVVALRLGGAGLPAGELEWLTGFAVVAAALAWWGQPAAAPLLLGVAAWGVDHTAAAAAAPVFLAAGALAVAAAGTAATRHADRAAMVGIRGRLTTPPSSSGGLAPLLALVAGTAVVVHVPVGRHGEGALVLLGAAVATAAAAGVRPDVVPGAGRLRSRPAVRRRRASLALGVGVTAALVALLAAPGAGLDVVGGAAGEGAAILGRGRGAWVGGVVLAGVLGGALALANRRGHPSS